MEDEKWGKKKKQKVYPNISVIIVNAYGLNMPNKRYSQIRREGAAK